MELFSVYATIGADANEFFKNIDVAEKKGSAFSNTKGKGFFERLRSSMSFLADGFLAAKGVVAAFNKTLGVFGLNAAKEGDRVDKMSQQIGMSRRAFQEWDFVLGQSGTTIDTAQRAILQLTENIQGVGPRAKAGQEAFQQLGFSVDHLRNKRPECVCQ